MSDEKTSIIGSQVLIAGPSGGVAGFGQSDGQPWWSFSETDKRPRVLSARGRAGPAYIDSLLHASLDLGDSTQP